MNIAVEISKDYFNANKIKETRAIIEDTSNMLAKKDFETYTKDSQPADLIKKTATWLGGAVITERTAVGKGIDLIREIK